MAGYGAIQSTATPKSGKERKAKMRASQRMIERRPCADPKRRAHLEKYPRKWLKHYVGEKAFYAGFSSAHRDMIDNCIWSADTGTGSTSALPRGDGKSTVYFGMGMYLVAIGKIRFPVCVPWKHVDAALMLDGWLSMLSDNEHFQADYPWLTQPFERSTHATAMKSLTWGPMIDGAEDNWPVTVKEGQACGAIVKTMQKLLVLPCNIGAIAARTAQGDAKGLWAPLQDGSRLRPDLLLFDDAQDPKQANNSSAVAKTFDTLVNVFMGMAGPTKRITFAAAVTVEAENDVSCKFLEYPGVRVIRRSRIVTWPGGGTGGDWPAKKDDPQRLLWDEWNRVRLDEGRKKANMFFRKRRKKMCEGMEVLWTERWDRDIDVCCYDAAMCDYYHLTPSVFARAQQNHPIQEGATLYTLTPEVIQSRRVERRAGELPEWAALRIAATDINPSYALTWGNGAFGPDQSCGIMNYGTQGIRLPEEATQVQTDQIVYEALVRNGKMLSELENPPDAWLIDAGGSNSNVVHLFVANSRKVCGMQATAARGYAAEHYKPYGRNVLGVSREQCHMTMDTKRHKWIAFNSHYWHEITQRAWLGSIGSPGSCSLPSGDHREFAEQCCRDKLIGKGDLGRGMRWEYHKQPGANDYGDVLTMMYVGAAFNGIGTGGEQPKAAKAAYFTGKPKRR